MKRKHKRSLRLYNRLGSYLRSNFSTCSTITTAAVDRHSTKNPNNEERKENGNKVDVDYIKRLCKEGRLKEAVGLLHALCQTDIKMVSSNVYAYLLQACVDEHSLTDGKRVHSLMKRMGYNKSDATFLQNHLLNMYMKCGSMMDACQVFDKMPQRNVYSSNMMIAGLAKCGDVHFARQVFDKMPERDVVSWTTVIAGYAQQGQEAAALQLFRQMQHAGMKPNNFTISTVMSASSRISVLDTSKQLHGYIIRTGMESYESVGNALITAYAEFGSIECADKLFNQMPRHNVVSWNAMIAGNVKCRNIGRARQLFDVMPERNMVSWTVMITGHEQLGHAAEAVEFFRKMLGDGVSPDEFTFASVISACARLLVLEWGRQVHGLSIITGFKPNVFVGSALVDMYAKCDSIENAFQVFDRMPERNVVSWTAMMVGYTQKGHADKALTLSCQMQFAGIKPDVLTFSSILSACGSLTALEQGERVHAHIVKSGFERFTDVCNSLLAMYAKAGSMDKAEHVFKTMLEQDEVSWTAMIVGYAQKGYGKEALNLFCKMQHAGMKPDEVTFSSVLSTCGSLTALEQGKQVHVCTFRSGFESFTDVCNALLTMYAKGGSIDKTEFIFKKMHERNKDSWNAMIVGCSQHGLGKEALKAFAEMVSSGMCPDHITFVGVLCACNHAGLIEEGRQCFDSMVNYKVTPKAEHYACMIDLLGRAGQLDDAEDLIDNMPFEPSGLEWGALLSACRTHGNVELGKRAAEKLFEMQPGNAATYILLSNIYAAAGRWDDMAMVRKMMRARGVKKDAGCSWIEVRNKLHTFLAGDTTHPQLKEITEMLKNLAGKMKEAGYLPYTNSSTQTDEYIE